MSVAGNMYQAYACNQVPGILADICIGGVQFKSGRCKVNVYTDGRVKVLDRNCVKTTEDSMRCLHVVDQKMEQLVIRVRTELAEGRYTV